MSADFPAIRHVLAQYRSTSDGHITKEQIEAAWAEYEAMRRLQQLRPQDVDSLLAALEWAVNHPDLNMGPGLHREGAIEAGRRIEALR